MALQFEIMPVTPFRQNCCLIWDDACKEAVLTDVGGDVAYVLQAVAARGLSLKEVWLTHGHLDHVAGIPELWKTQQLPVVGPHEDDTYLLESLSEVTASYSAYGFPVSPSFVPTRWLVEGDKLVVGAYEFEVLHIPGHTPGHVVFYCAAVGLLVGGDVLFYESVGRTDFPRGSHDDLISNIGTKLLVLPEDTRVIPGHGRVTTIGHEKRHNPFL